MAPTGWNQARCHITLNLAEKNNNFNVFQRCRVLQSVPELHDNTTLTIPSKIKLSVPSDVGLYLLLVVQVQRQPEKEGSKSAWCFQPPGGPELLVDLQCESEWGCAVLTSGSWNQPQPVGLFALNAALLSFSPISTWKAVSGCSRFEPLGLSPSADWILHKLFSWCGFPHVVFILFFLMVHSNKSTLRSFFHTFFDGMFPMYFFHKLPWGILKRGGKALKVIGSSICLSPTDGPIRFVYGRN